jgi:hypothetical protein
MHQTGFPGSSPWAWRTVSALSTFGSTTASIASSSHFDASLDFQHFR